MMSLFGKNISDELKNTIHDELLANTKDMVGEDVYNENPSYYGKDTELFARFLQRMFTDPLYLEELAPNALEKIMQASVNNKIIAEYMEAARGKIDSLQLKFPEVFKYVLDQKQRLQQVLGERAGTRAYNTIIHREAEQARSKMVFERELKKKFKGIKNTAGVFQAIEATLKTE